MIDRFSEEQLGMGPNMACLRLIAAMHDLHVVMMYKKGCRSEHMERGGPSVSIIDRLIWVCNGYCSHCHREYMISVGLSSGTTGKCIRDLLKYTR